MKPKVLLDTGPLVTMISEDARSHPLTGLILEGCQAPLLTCWPVMTEAAYLLRHRADHVALLMRSVEDGLIRIEPISQNELPQTGSLLSRYTNLRLQLADACLLHLADRLGVEHVLTFDQRDFGAARTASGRALKVLPD